MWTAEFVMAFVRKGQSMDGSCSPSTSASSGSRSCDTPEVVLFACKICTFRPINPVKTACGHLFCWPCMHRLLQGQAKPCPVCSTLLSSEINVAPITTNYGSLMLFLPTVGRQVKRNEDESDGSSSNVMVEVPGRALVETTTDVLIFYVENKRIRRQIQRLQRRVHREKRGLLRIGRNQDESVPISTGENRLGEGVELLQWRVRRAACLLRHSERRHAN